MLPRNQDAYITPAVLQWARERRGMEQATLAKRIGAKVEQVKGWEEGTNNHPTFTQALNIAAALGIPFGYLFLSKKPNESVGLPDLRTLPTDRPISPSAELLDTVNDVRIKQRWYRAFIIEGGASSKDFVGKFNIADSVETVAEHIRDTISIEAVKKNTGTYEDFFKALIANTEKNGVLVMRNGVMGSNNNRGLSVNEFRGFAIADKFAPLVFINAKDSRAAQIFTLAHELAHVWLGAEGISNPRNIRATEDNAIERRCNAIAAEVLVPEKTFSAQWNTGKEPEVNAKRVAVINRVSMLVAFRRAFDLGRLKKEDYQRLYNKAAEDYIRRERPEGGGGNYYFTLPIRNSRRFTETVVTGAAEGRVLLREAARLLNSSVPNIYNMVERLGSS